jgi:hypothetical protein
MKKIIIKLVIFSLISNSSLLAEEQSQPDLVNLTVQSIAYNQLRISVDNIGDPCGSMKWYIGSSSWKYLSTADINQLEAGNSVDITVDLYYGSYNFVLEGMYVYDEEILSGTTDIISQQFSHTEGVSGPPPPPPPPTINTVTSLSISESFDAILIDQKLTTQRAWLPSYHIYSNYFRFDGIQDIFTFYMKSLVSGC